ncbi:MAG: hypothetical protein K1X94_18670 [Sandaracinaceae bacterium]|nr:hypothetical protein [Sandaracinaceae bacterium]
MTSTSSRRLAALSLVAASALSSARVEAQATCIDSTGEACLNVVRAARPDGVVEDIFTTRDGLYAPQLTFATYIRGVNGCIGVTHTPTILEGYTCGMAGSDPPGGNDPAFQANSLDWYWTQVVRTRDDGTSVADGEAGSYVPSRGRIYDLGGEANRVVLFPITDHPPLPCEAFEYTVWLSNDPDTTRVATPDAPDPLAWNPARLIRAYTQGWTRNPTAHGAADRDRADLATYLRDNSAGEAVADALATVWALPCGLSFRYVAIQGGNNGNPGPECEFNSSEDELDAAAGLNEDDTAICIDADGDGHRAASCGGSDCNDMDPRIHPGAFEPCDATEDLDCMPATACPAGTSCDAASGLCANNCFEGGCSDGFTCSAGGYCTESACAMRTEPCPDGTICRAGACVEPCEGVTCPHGQICAGGACLDPCQGVVCPAMQVCIANQPGALTLCGPACTCLDLPSSTLCATGTVCDARMGSPTSGLCVEPGCETATCEAGQVCVGGSCVDACAGVTCPLGQRCELGACIADRCAAVTCGTGSVCHEGMCVDPCDLAMCDVGERCVSGTCEADPCFGVDCGADAHCVEGACIANGGPDTGSSIDGGTTVRTDAGGRMAPTSDGCGCRVAARPADARLALGGLLAMLGLVASRRRRARSPQ